MEERILVPLDGSELGEAVISKLEDLVLRGVPGKDVEVTLVHVLSQMNFNVLTDDKAAQLPLSEEELTELTRKSKDYLEKVAEGLRSKGIRVETMVKLGHAAEEIVKAAHEIKAHLIAMSTHGRSGIVRWAIGSVTDKVIQMEEQIPVLAVKASGKKESPVISIESLQSLVKHS